MNSGDSSVSKSGGQVVRCAVYTRKSTDEGLDRDFNSLDAQREAAEAYIKSQRHLGWKLISERYDDGGFSGATMDRPALQKLLEDVQSKRVDCIVVYKVDRLSRSLLDFARLVDLFDQRSVSFVSITQQFNTTTSLGRLTLNILLSFAQFEREIISERTRDKMGAARRKGKWVGGTPVLGYDIEPGGGRLIVNTREAESVEAIFRLFKKNQLLSVVLKETERRGWTTKSWTSKGGRQHSGKPFTKASLQRLLTHAVYAGKVEYRGTIYAGEHEAIVEQSLWEEVNVTVRARRRKAPTAACIPQNALLAGILKCASCSQPMIATYTSKKGRRYRYYVCNTARKRGWSACPTKSVPAPFIEDFVTAKLRELLLDESTRRELSIDAPDWERDLADRSFEIVHNLIRTVTYDGTLGAVSLDVREQENAV